ncbi:MAG: ABC transporter permease [Bacteroidetes bacterium]|nr:ABC transporter permease [Bacteroidota bacterium]
MGISYFISRRLLSFSKENFSTPIIRISIFSVAIGLAVMIISVAVVTGFQQEIRNKVVGFGGHIQITGFSDNESMEPEPVSMNQLFYPSLKDKPGIGHIQVFASKAGIIRTRDQIQGTVLKGLGADFDVSFFQKQLLQGNLPDTRSETRSDDMVISGKLCSLLDLKLGDTIRMYFISGSHTLARKFRISGIYETGMEEFDLVYVMADIRHVQKLNGWGADQVAGFEVLIAQFTELDKMAEEVYRSIGYDLNCRTIKQLYPQIFDWLALQDMNVLIILGLMAIVTTITMISTLLILILENTSRIGILKAMGMRNWSIRRMFLYHASFILIIGLLIGNFLGVGLCFLQKYSGLISLSQESYYVSVVPIHLNFWYVVIVNMATLIFCTLALILPSYIITRISPVRAIRFS